MRQILDRPGMQRQPAASPPKRPGARPERRGEKRHLALLRVALLHAGPCKDLCVVKNISASGLAVRVYRDLPSGAKVQVEFRSGEMLEGSVVWKRGEDVGIVFPRTIDVEAVLASTWTIEAGRRRNLPRIEIECDGRMKRGTAIHQVRLQDISQGGARIRLDNIVDPGGVVLTLPGLPPMSGVVRWASDTLAGISFNECLSFEMLARWIEARRGGASATEGEILLVSRRSQKASAA
jgi:hypothetical protein